jgi:prevent-host-death family protein
MSLQMQEAKQRFSGLVRQAIEAEPQIITRHGDEVVVVLSTREYNRLRGNVPTFKDFLLEAPDLSHLDLGATIRYRGRLKENMTALNVLGGTQHANRTRFYGTYGRLTASRPDRVCCHGFQ